MEDKIKAIAKEFFDNLNVTMNSIEVKKEQENIYNIIINSDESGIIIGFSGKTLESIRKIIRMIISKKLGDDIIIHIEINDYIKEKENKLFSFIKSKIEYVNKTKNEVRLPFFSSYERKKIHSYVSQLGNNDIFTKSIGEGKERRLHIYKKDEKITIDIDSLDI